MSKKKSADLENGSIGKLLVTLAVPSIIAQIVNLLYNIVDRIFIGRMPSGDLAMAGIGIVTPIVLLVTAFSSLVGFGGSPRVAIKMGQKDEEGAEEILGNSFSLIIIIGLILTTVFFIFKEQIVMAFGGSSNTAQYAIDYLSIYLIGTVFVQIAVGMNPYINTQGFTKIGMMTVAIGAGLNIILDPIFIFGLNLGVKGAALATIISQFVSAMFVLKFLFGNKTLLKIRKKHLKLKKDVVLATLALGIAPFIMQSTESIVLISLNNQLLKYGGDIAVSAMTIMSSMMQMIMLPMTGLTQGAQPILSYNYGAKRYDRVKKTFKLLFISSLTFTMCAVSLLMLFPAFFVKIFNSDPALVEMTSWSMRIYFAGMGIFGMQLSCQQTFLSLGEAKISLFLALLRKMILLVPLIFILPAFMKDGLTAVLLAEPIADIIACLTTTTMFTIFFKKKFSKEGENQITAKAQ
ncbi:MATE family efflux transporter [Intestinibacter sp.]|uniref:MATE family efflux transporter n=1 Tax=Intestinibacter sp. TaxID=1965304 RepID=UPI002A918462|nr:MATE family efflux transporter [Intestinibacter sp.]MDY5211599.1 MATE family efflux transporter [Intestinibacter sp.]